MVHRWSVWYSNFSKVISCDRFHLRQDFLYFNGKENSSYDSNNGRRDCCQKFCLFIDMKLCRKLYYPKKKMSVDKSLALFKCQLYFKQYIKTKRVCFGIKLYKLTSSNSTRLTSSVNSRKRIFHNKDENSDMSAPERTPFCQIIFSLTSKTWYTTSFR